MGDSSQALFSFGLITDVQYADRNDGMNFCQTRKRYYRKAIQCLEGAVEYWNKYEKLKFALQLGDLLDGHCKRNGTTPDALERLEQVLRKSNCPIAHCWGNHELYNFSRESLLISTLYPDTVIENDFTCCSIGSEVKFVTSSTVKEDGLCCYHFSPHSGFRFVVIDCYDISALGRDESHAKTQEACEFLSSVNPNVDRNDHRNALLPKYVKYNGKIGSDQLHWLKNTLTYSDANCEKVIICGHIPAHPHATQDSRCLIWNNEELLNLIEQHDCVVAYFAGHDHEGARRYCTPRGVHHCTFNSVLEAVPKSEGGNETAFATITVFIDKMVVRGHGDIKSGTLLFT